MARSKKTRPVKGSWMDKLEKKGKRNTSAFESEYVDLGQQAKAKYVRLLNPVREGFFLGIGLSFSMGIIYSLAYILLVVLEMI